MILLLRRTLVVRNYTCQVTFLDSYNLHVNIKRQEKQQANPAPDGTHDTHDYIGNRLPA